MMVVPLVKLVLKEKRDELCCHAGDTQHCVKPLTLWPPATGQTEHQPQGDEGSVKINLRLHCSHLLLIRIPSKPSFHSLHWKQFLLGSWWMRAHKFNTTLHPVDKIEKSFHNEFEEAVTSPGQSQRRPRSGDNYLSAAKKTLMRALFCWIHVQWS